MGEEADEAHFFTLNFDLLLEHALLNPALLNLADRMTDFFLPEDPPPGWWPPGFQSFEFLPGIVEALLPQWETKVYLYHLHGSLSYLVNRPTGRVFKVTAEALREGDLYGQLLAQPAPTWSPAIVLGGSKERKTTERPFSFAFQQLERLVRSPDTEHVIVVGYRFADPHVNGVLTRRRNGIRLVVIDRQDEAHRAVFRATVITALHSDLVDFHFGGANSEELPQP